MVKHVFNHYVLSLKAVIFGREGRLREVALVKVLLLRVGPLQDAVVGGGNIFEALHVASSEVELSGTLNILRLLRNYFLLLFWLKGINHPEHFLFVLFDAGGQLGKLLIFEYFPMFGVVLDDLLQIFMVFLLQMTITQQIFIPQLNQRLRQLFLSDQRPDHSLNCQCGLSHIVSTFKHAEHRFVELHQSSSHVVVGIGRDRKSAHWVPPGRVEAAGDEDKLGIERLDYRMYDPIVKVNVLVVARCLEIVRQTLLADHVERDVQLGPLSLARANIRVICELPRGVVCSPVVPMHRDE